MVSGILSRSERVMTPCAAAQSTWSTRFSKMTWEPVIPT